MMKRQAAAVIPTPWGNFNMVAFAENEAERMPHLAMIHEKTTTSAPVLVRMHSECLTGDLFGSKRCDCGEQLEKAMEMCGQEGGIVLYLRQEGRNIGLINKLKAYNLQDEGADTYEANRALGLAEDARDFTIAAEMLKALGISRAKLLTNNPAKVGGLEAGGVTVVERISTEEYLTPHNAAYLRAKAEYGHVFDKRMAPAKSGT